MRVTHLPQIVMDLNSKIDNIRSDFERGSIPNSILVSLYSGYNKEVDSSVFVTKSKKMFPKLNCGLTSLYIQKKLGEGEIVRGSYLGNPHTFLMLDDKQIVDITADQYGGLGVYIGKIKQPWKLPKMA